MLECKRYQMLILEKGKQNDEARIGIPQHV